MAARHKPFDAFAEPKATGKQRYRQINDHLNKVSVPYFAKLPQSRL